MEANTKKVKATDINPENSRRYVVLTYLECMKELQKEKARVAELEDQLWKNVCGFCEKSETGKYDPSFCKFCDRIVCWGCSCYQKRVYLVDVCNSCLSKRPKCSHCNYIWFNEYEVCPRCKN